MRIPVNACKGCNEQAPMLSWGIHPLADGTSMRCAFVRAEMLEFPGDRLHSVHTTKSEAVRAAKKHSGGLLWCGQSPIEYWIVALRLRGPVVLGE